MKTMAVGTAFALLWAPMALWGQDTYLGDPPTNCSGCHAAYVTPWLDTGHAAAFDSIPFLGYSCLPCHTTGWDEGVTNFGADEFVTEGASNSFTITDPTNFNLVKNVQCETCHGPVGDATRTFTILQHLAAPPNVSFDAANCGTCHQGSHHPTYTDWQASLHAVSKATRFNMPFIATSRTCAGCHTAEGFLQWALQSGLEPDVDPPGDTGADLTCAACHDPHGTPNAANLRMPAVQICVKCHNPEYDPANPVPGEAVHHATAYMFEGIGGFEFPGFSYPTSAHKFVVTEKCVTCHVFTLPYQSGPPEVPAYTGHTFEPRGEACVTCHGDFAGSFDYRGMQTEIDGLIADLRAMLAAASPEDSLRDEFKQAQFNLEFVESDGSRGIHNTAYARALLQASITVMSTVPVAIEDFAAEAHVDGVLLSWRLADNWREDLRGLAVQRADQAEGPYVELAGSFEPNATMSYLDTTVEPGRTYWYRLLSMADDGTTLAGPIQVTATGRDLRTELLAPFVPADGGPVQIRYNLASSSGTVRLEVFDVRGRLLRVLDNTARKPGAYVKTWDRRDQAGAPVSHGVYFVNLRAEGKTFSKKVVLLGH